MSSFQLTLQMKIGAAWRDAATLTVDPDRPWVQVTHEVDHVFPGDDTLDALPDTFRAVSLRHPLDLTARSHLHWPAMLDDIVPGGAARRWWVERHGLTRLAPDAQYARLLGEATVAPVGHLRIKEAVEPLLGEAEPVTFSVSSVLEREYEFLEHAYRQGASVGGATGAGGDAPKLLLRQRGDDEVWIDALQDDLLPDAHVLVKFPRRSHRPGDGGPPRETDRDRVVLESEFIYYRALAELGVDTINVDGLVLRHNAGGQPSLWMPRFDVEGATRLGLESLYALTDRPPGSICDHQLFLDTLHRVLVVGEFVADGSTRRTHPSEAGTDLAYEYIRRDLLNVVLGNPDNHGRNMAVLKTPTGVRLAPVFDVAPMAMDPDGTLRSTRWARALEGHTVDWRAICRAQAHIADAEAIWERLREFAVTLVDLDARLEALGLPMETLEFPAIGLRRTHDKLRAWDLLS